MSAWSERAATSLSKRCRSGIAAAWKGRVESTASSSHAPCFDAFAELARLGGEICAVWEGARPVGIWSRLANHSSRKG
jgi:hypothetical protein